MGLFVRPDWFEVTQSGVGTNRYSYAFNDPVNLRDPGGNVAGVDDAAAAGIAVAAIVAIYAAETISDKLDDGKLNGSGPLAGAGRAAVDATVEVAVNVANAVGSSIKEALPGWIANLNTSKTEDTDQTKTIAATSETKTNENTQIYRTGTGTNMNMTPRDVDIGGLSFTTVKPSKGIFSVTTIGTLNQSGMFKAVQDSPTHVSVTPSDSSQMSGWIASRPTANVAPHALTIGIKSLTYRQRHE